MTLVTGLRRTGKTSLMRVTLNEAGVDYVYVDVRLGLYANYRDVVELFIGAINDFLRRRSSIVDRIINAFRNVEGLRVSLTHLGFP